MARLNEAEEQERSTQRVVNPNTPGTSHESRTDKLARLRADPEMVELVHEMVAQELKAKESSGTESDNNYTTPLRQRKHRGNAINMPNRRVVKSPSDTTIYVPAVQRVTNRGVDHVIDQIAHFVQGIRVNDTGRSPARRPIESDRQQQQQVSSTDTGSDDSDREHPDHNPREDR